MEKCLPVRGISRKRDIGLKSQERRSRVKWLFYLPGLITNTLFGWYPLVMGFIVAFQVYYFREAEFVGFANFGHILHDPQLIISLRNPLYYTALSLGLVFIVPIIISILLMEQMRF